MSFIITLFKNIDIYNDNYKERLKPQIRRAVIQVARIIPQLEDSELALRTVCDQMENSWGITASKSLFLNLLCVILPQIAGNLSFAIVVLTGYIKSLPIELEEAAYMEGSTAFQTFFQVVVPLTKPSFATVAIFSFLWSYNDLFTQTFFLRIQNQWAITRLLKELTAMEGTNYGLMAAAVTIVILPVIIIYAFLQKYIIKGLTAGAIKG